MLKDTEFEKYFLLLTAFIVTEILSYRLRNKSLLGNQ